jgi:prepilin-type N-terminal cleavage/methylation domain-containing protein
MRHDAGFTLVEMIVAVALFAVVMLVAVGALLSLTEANRKAQALQSVMNNLNIALDGMVRNIRMGTEYHCGPGSFTGDGTDDCSGGGISFSFKPYCDPARCDAASEKTWVYTFVAPTDTAKGYIERSEDGGVSWVQLTAPEVSIESMTFYVIGSKPGDATQPKVLMVVKGEAGTGSAKTDTTFHIEATAVQRQLDLK